MSINKNKLFVNKDWTEEEKARYFKQYMSNKEMLRKWHKAPKNLKEIQMYSYGIDDAKEELWDNIIGEQLYEPLIQTRLTAKIW